MDRVSKKHLIYYITPTAKLVNFSLKSDIICIGICLFIRDGNMAILKSNVCNMCGGLLDIDIDRQVYICPFCGVTFDYEYFRKDNVLQIAKKAMLRKEFGGAEDAFTYMLKKDPHNFEALRGLILCKCKWGSFTPMFLEDGVFLQPNDPVLINAIENCQPEFKDYFEMIKQALEVLHCYRKGRAELADLEDDKRIWTSKLNDICLSQAINDSRFVRWCDDFRDSLTTSNGESFLGLVLYFGIGILFGIGAATIVGKMYWLPVLIIAIIILIVVIYNVKKQFNDRALEATKKPLRDRLKIIREDMDKLNDETNAYMKTYKNLVGTIVNTYPIVDEEGNRVGTTFGTMPVMKMNKKSPDFPSSTKMH